MRTLILIVTVLMGAPSFSEVLNLNYDPGFEDLDVGGVFSDSGETLYQVVSVRPLDPLNRSEAALAAASDPALLDQYGERGLRLVTLRRACTDPECIEGGGLVYMTVVPSQDLAMKQERFMTSLDGPNVVGSSIKGGFFHDGKGALMRIVILLSN